MLKRANKYLFYASLILVVLCNQGYGASPKGPVLIKVGISEYQNIEDTYSDYQKLFYFLSRLSALSDQPNASGEPTAIFEVSVGSYDEVLEWWHNGQIDAAVLAATPVATLLASDPGASKKLEDFYIATLGERHDDNDAERPLLNAFCDQRTGLECDDPLRRQRHDDGARYYYRSLAVVNRDAFPNGGHPLNFRDVQGKIARYLFVRPGSASGYVVPLNFLQHAGLSKAPFLSDAREQYFTYQHKNSLTELLNSKTPAVAFVYDSVRVTDKTDKDLAKKILTKIQRLHGTDYLDNTRIPFNALFLNYNRPAAAQQLNKKILLSALKRLNTPGHVLPAWVEDYRKNGSFVLSRMKNWLAGYNPLVQILTSPPPQLIHSTPVILSFSDISDELERFANCKKNGKNVSCEHIPRLAVVLSGGGAKCAYQAGALAGVEEVLEQKREKCRENGGDPKSCANIFNIDLLVGTSGGSINALLGAIANTQTPGGRLGLEKIWAGLNQNDLVDPSSRLRLWLTLSFGMLQAFVLTVLVAMFATGNWRRFLDVFLILCVLLLSLFFFVSGGRSVPVFLLIEVVLVAVLIVIKPLRQGIKKKFGKYLFGKHLLRALLIALLVESIFFASRGGDLHKPVLLGLFLLLFCAAVFLAIVYKATRYLLNLKSLNHLRGARVFAAIIAILLALLKVVMDVHPFAVQTAQSSASGLLRVLALTSEIPVSYAIPINIALVVQLLVLVFLVLTDVSKRKLKASTDWRFYVVVLLTVAAALVPIPRESGARKDLVLSSANVVAALFLLQATLWFGLFIISKSLKESTSAEGGSSAEGGASAKADKCPQKGKMHWWTAASAIVFGFSIVEFCVALIWVLMDYWSPLTNHWILHLGLVFILLLIFRWVLAAPVFIGLGMLLTPWVLERLKITWDWNQRRALLLSSLAGLAIAFATLVTAVLFFLEVSISSSTGITRVFAEKMPTVVAGVDPDRTYPDLEQKCSEDRRLCSISRQLINGKMIKRDLLITASRLHDHEENSKLLPDDLYFYVSRSTEEVPWDNRFVSLDNNPYDLLDAVIGSSTIYPVFPPKPLKRVYMRKGVGTGMGEQPEVDIIDGGFIHNSPIEAAKSWGATHIVLIEASPSESSGPAHSFEEHVANALDYLFSQAQRTDMSSKGSVEVFEIRPDGENAMDVMDFNPRLIQGALQRGKNDVLANGNGFEPKFHRITPAPVFRPQYQSFGDELQASKTSNEPAQPVGKIVAQLR